MDFDRFLQWFITNHPQGLEYMELGYVYSRTFWGERGWLQVHVTGPGYRLASSLRIRAQGIWREH